MVIRSGIQRSTGVMAEEEEEEEEEKERKKEKNPTGKV